MVAKRRGWGRGRMDWELGISRCKLLYTEREKEREERKRENR